MADKDKSFLQALKDSFKPSAERLGSKTKRRRRRVGFLGSESAPRKTDISQFKSIGSGSRDLLRQDKKRNK